MAGSSSRSSSSAGSSDANPLGDHDLTPRGMRIVFREAERGPSDLRRGWRTPDPSPTRGGGAGLPRCAAARCEVDYFPVEAEREEEPTRRWRREASPMPPWLRQRTPSPDAQPYAYYGADDGSIPVAWPESPEMVAVPVQPMVCVLACDQMWPSVGSVGHPYCCKGPCKYVRKAKGCKDGAGCDHCHLCEWKKAKRPQSL